ncbi:MAG: hypothetical protein NWQ23_00605 [Yoonia sp.]|uniref:hypothetical protein n=1 Tax=Yoonia sp. TaxID=2212373 RepID=UPI00273D89B5|nr:hypothetical protein [Yoonia sp.]MDP5083886.1 hypothetical protein [Yoonia sp.]
METLPFEPITQSDIYRIIVWALAPTFVAFVILVVLRFRRTVRGQVNPSDLVKTTATGNLSGGIAPELSLLAGAGAGGPAHETLGEKFLRPTWGLRLITLGIPALAIYFLAQTRTTGDLAFPAVDLAMNGGILAVMVHVLVYTNTYELRYDRDRFAHRNWFYQRREFHWSEIRSIRDDNAYFYEIRMKRRAKAYVPKHLVGIEGFVETVQTSIARNESQ